MQLRVDPGYIESRPIPRRVPGRKMHPVRQPRRTYSEKRVVVALCQLINGVAVPLSGAALTASSWPRVLRQLMSGSLQLRRLPARVDQYDLDLLHRGHPHAVGVAIADLQELDNEHDN